MNEPARRRREASDTLVQLHQYLADPLARCEERMRQAVLGGADSTTQLLSGALRKGGKRIRPILALLAAQAFGGALERAVDVAGGVELIHMASLLHDDVVDHAATRRGNPTLHSLWGNKLAVLGGDFILAQALKLILNTGELSLMDDMATTVAEMGEGEIMQIFHLFDPTITEDDYLARIRRKTAVLMSCACKMGAQVAGASPRAVQLLADYGMEVGMAFQVVDDLLDYGDQATVGKPVGHDLREGNLTLPVIHALRGSAGDDIRDSIERRDLTPERIEQIAGLVRQNGSLDYAFQAAEEYVRKARASLASLPPGANAEWLDSLAVYLLSRDF